MTPAVDSARAAWWRGAIGVLAGALLFNLGQGVLRPTMPLYLQQVFSANYRMVTAIPTVFGAGKWVASLPTGYLLGWLGRRPLMVSGLLVIALSDVASVMTSAYGVLLGFRAIAGVGWAMFGTVATATMVDLPAAQRRGRAVSLLMMSETSGLLLGTAAGGWLYQGLGVASPFLFEAACLLAAAIFVARWALPPASQEPAAGGWGDRHQLGAVLRAPGVLDASVTNAVLTVIQTGVLVFLFPSISSTAAGSRQQPSACSRAWVSSAGSWRCGSEAVSRTAGAACGSWLPVCLPTRPCWAPCRS